MVHIKKKNSSQMHKILFVCIYIYVSFNVVNYRKENKKYAYGDNILNHFDKILPQS